MMNGCICCTVRGDLVETLKLATRWRSSAASSSSDRPRRSAPVARVRGRGARARARPSRRGARPSRGAGSAGGGAERDARARGFDYPPRSRDAQTFFVDENIQKLYSLDCIVAVCDAKHLEMRLDDEKPEGVENEAVEQLAFADRVLLNKIDLVPDEKDLALIEARIREINPEVKIIRTEQSKVDWRAVIGVGGFDLDRVLAFEPEFLTDLDAEHQHDDSISSVSVKFEGELMVKGLSNWVSELIQTKGADLFRYKGVMAVKGAETKFIFQGVGMLFTGGFSDFEWGPDEPRECRFVFIGRNLDKKELVDGVMACKVTGELRFKVGDEVFARTGRGWEPGIIIELWDEGNPYRIELEDDEATNLWGPMDDDMFVKPR